MIPWMEEESVALSAKNILQKMSIRGSSFTTPRHLGDVCNTFETGKRHQTIPFGYMILGNLPNIVGNMQIEPLEWNVVVDVTIVLLLIKAANV